MPSDEVVAADSLWKNWLQNIKHMKKKNLPAAHWRDHEGVTFLRIRRAEELHPPPSCQQYYPDCNANPWRCPNNLNFEHIRLHTWSEPYSPCRMSMIIWFSWTVKVEIPGRRSRVQLMQWWGSFVAKAPLECNGRIMYKASFFYYSIIQPLICSSSSGWSKQRLFMVK
jgi:hypothetical protein